MTNTKVQVDPGTSVIVPGSLVYCPRHVGRVIIGPTGFKLVPESVDSEVIPMSSRAEPRHLIRLRIKVAGTDERGNRFAQTAFTHDVSARGARISQVPPLLCPAAVIDVEYRGRRSPFRVVWVGGFAQNEVGLLSLEPSRRIWGTPLPGQRCTGTVPPAATRPDLRVVANTVIADQPGRSAATQAVLPEKAKRVGYFCKDSECRKTHAFHLIPDDTVVWDIWPQKIECPLSKQRYEYWKADVRPAGYV